MFKPRNNVLKDSHILRYKYNKTHPLRAHFKFSSTKSLKRYFVKRVADIIANKGLDVAAWEDGVYADGKPNPIADFLSRYIAVDKSL